MKQNKIIPPPLAQKLLIRVIRPDLIEEVLGDLEEKFFENLKIHSVFRSKWNYWIQVFRYFRPFAIRKKSATTTRHFMMYKNYFKTAIRTSQRQKVYSFLNISGLSTGMAVTILISLWVWDEVSFDRAHQENYSSTAMVIHNVTLNGEIETWKYVPYPLADELRKNFSQDFEYVVLGTDPFEQVITVGDRKFTKSGSFMEPEGTHLFSLRMISGSSETLKETKSVLISRSLSLTLFGTTDVVNKEFRMLQNVDLKVAGVYEDFPENSTFHEMYFLAPWQLLVEQTDWIRSMSDPWRPNAFQVFVKLKPHASIESVSQKIKDTELKHLNAKLANRKPELFLWPMSEWHLYPEFKNGKNVGGVIQYVWLFGIIGVAVLLLACVNFMNLCTARAERRAKEIGVRKSIGSARSQLILQFFSESFLMVFVSLSVALVIAYLSIPFFNLMSNKHLSMPWGSSYFWLACFGFAAITGLLAGSYPAFYLSSFNTVSVLRGNFKQLGGAISLRRVLVVFQFSVSVVMIIGTMVVFRQIQFARSRPMGYDTKRLMVIPMFNKKIHDSFESVAAEFKNSGMFVSVAESTVRPTSTGPTSSGFTWQGKDPNLSVDFPFCAVSHEYGSTIGWQMALGRDFSREFISDSSAMIINEAALKFMNLKEPIGAVIGWNGDNFHIVGVVKDLVMQSPYDPIRPMVFTLRSMSGNFLLARINGSAGTTSAIAQAETTFKKYNTDQPFEYTFADNDYARKFDREEKIGKLTSAFAALAISISCLGIFGLAAFVVEQRTKEVGIRKILGASTLAIWELLSREFVLLVAISWAIATPIGYWLLNNWLNDFNYRTEIAVEVFMLAFLGAMIITLLTISTQAIKAAVSNPVKSLRSE